ncbi:YfcE family phosphodiesterase [bacterium]|nr:YfcE family phosphodiesterase [bacterium]
MRVLLLSDTHSYLDSRILEHAATADEVWHAGDIGSLAVTDALAQVAVLRAVYGNIDDAAARRCFPLHQRFEIEGLSVWITHIGGYPGHYAPGIRTEIKHNPPGLFVCGHSHILKAMPDPALKLLHLNPGAAGFHGFHKVRTLMRFRVEAGKVRDLEVIELFPRYLTEQ